MILDEVPRRSTVPLRVAVIGCGSVVRLLHLPVLAGHGNVRLAAFVDPNLAAAQELAVAYQVPKVCKDIGELDFQEIDAALIASPPFHHAQAAIALLQRGIHVLVEKPMALNSQEATAIVQAAEYGKAVLSAGYFRRVYPSSRMLRSLVDEEFLGRPLRFDVEEGCVADWPAASFGALERKQAGGGVLIDTGSHTIDQLLFFLPGPSEPIVYHDNSLGGVESDCHVRLRIQHRSGPVEGRVELSRTRQLRNTFRIECERGTLELPVGERYRVLVKRDSFQLLDARCGRAADVCEEIAWKGRPDDSSICAVPDGSR